MKFLGIGMRNVDLIIEADRRLRTCDLHEKSKPVLSRWIGLGTEAAYRSAIQQELMRWHNGQVPPPRCMGWLCFTRKGLKEYRRIKRENRHLFSKPDTNKIENNYMMYGGITG